MLGGTALASTGAAHGIATAPAAGNPACQYTFYFMGFPIVVSCPAPASNGGTANNNCNANCAASATGTNGKNPLTSRVVQGPDVETALDNDQSPLPGQAPWWIGRVAALWHLCPDELVKPHDRACGERPGTAL